MSEHTHMPRTSVELAAGLGVAEDRPARLLYALAVTGLLEVRDGRFANAPEAAAFLVKGLPDYVGGHHEMMSKIWTASRSRQATSWRPPTGDARRGRAAGPRAGAGFGRCRPCHCQRRGAGWGELSQSTMSFTGSSVIRATKTR